MLENTESGQGMLIRELQRNGFVICEIHDHGFYFSKMKEELLKPLERIKQKDAEGESSE